MPQKKKDDDVWEDCGCPLSMANATFTPGLAAITSLPHACTISSAEFTKVYICDRGAFERLVAVPAASPLALWARQRMRDSRLFVAKPPPRPVPPPELWRSDGPPEDWTLPPGWRAWDPDFPGVEDYQVKLDLFFVYMNITDPLQQKRMRDGMEAYTVACGDAHALVKGKHPAMSDRCFVTRSGELLAYLFAAGDRLKGFLKEMKLRGRVRNLRRLTDLMIDAKVKVGGCGHTFIP